MSVIVTPVLYILSTWPTCHIKCITNTSVSSCTSCSSLWYFFFLFLFSVNFRSNMISRLICIFMALLLIGCKQI